MVAATEIRRIAVTLAVAAAGGFMAQLLGAPLPWLLGALLATAAAVMADPGRAAAHFALPPGFRLVFVPVIGVAIGATVAPGMLDQVVRWWPSLIAVVPFVVVVQLLNFAVLRRVGGYDPATAFFAASPGGLVEAVLIGERRGGLAAEMAMQHFARIAITVAVVPVIARLLADADPGQAAAGPAAGWPGLPGAAVLLACGVVGAAAARRLRFPAAVMIGPFLVCAAVQAAGLTDAHVPAVLVAGAQVVVGASLGLRFTGMERRRVLRGFRLACLCVAVALVTAVVVTAGLATLHVAAPPAIFLAFSPGGVAEMGLVAVSLALDPAYVATHHLLRIIAAVLIGPLLFDLVVARTAAPVEPHDPGPEAPD